MAVPSGVWQILGRKVRNSAWPKVVDRFRCVAVVPDPRRRDKSGRRERNCFLVMGLESVRGRHPAMSRDLVAIDLHGLFGWSGRDEEPGIEPTG